MGRRPRQKHGRFLLAGLLGVLAGCTGLWGEPAGRPAQAPLVAQPSPPPDGQEAAQQCGAALGVAVRCNLLRDEMAFAHLRKATLAGLEARYGRTVERRRQLAEALDLAALDRIGAIGRCDASLEERERLTQALRQSLADCAAR
jgi:hypothetical protein